MADKPIRLIPVQNQNLVDRLEQSMHHTNNRMIKPNLNLYKFLCECDMLNKRGIKHLEQITQIAERYATLSNDNETQPEKEKP